MGGRGATRAIPLPGAHFAAYPARRLQTCPTPCCPAVPLLWASALAPTGEPLLEALEAAHQDREHLERRAASLAAEVALLAREKALARAEVEDLRIKARGPGQAVGLGKVRGSALQLWLGLLVGPQAQPRAARLG
jgi:multidrug resistance efflux pump